jgi:hypothetical protein
MGGTRGGDHHQGAGLDSGGPVGRELVRGPACHPPRLLPRTPGLEPASRLGAGTSPDCPVRSARKVELHAPATLRGEQPEGGPLSR